MSPAHFRDLIITQNDGSLPQEPPQRGAQSLLEAWLRDVCAKNPLIELTVGQTFKSLVEEEALVRCTMMDMNGATTTIESEFVIACDGANSQVRKTVGISLDGGPLPTVLYLVHFRSKDLTRIHSQGQFWHIFFTNGGVIIAQDERDTWTVHFTIAVAQDPSVLDPLEIIYLVLGGSTGPYEIKVDEIITSGCWRPGISVASRYRSDGGRIFLAGDAAHQTVPTGGYGGSTGFGDAYDISWKLAAVINGFGGEELLQSYESERKPVAEQNTKRSLIHMRHHGTRLKWVRDLSDPSLVTADSHDAAELRKRIINHIEENDSEHKDLGIELDYRFTESSIVSQETDGDATEPAWKLREYVPTTWPGHRAPHVLLSDGITTIFDLYGLEFSVLDFSTQGAALETFDASAKKLGIPLTLVHLPNETHARKIWERDVVLVRPDGYVAWRIPAGCMVVTKADAQAALLRAVGRGGRSLESKM